MKFTDKEIKDILIAGAYVTPDDLGSAEQVAKDRKISLVDALMIQGFLNKDLLGQAIAESLKIPYADLNSKHPKAEDIFKISEEIARKKRVVIFESNNDSVVIASDKPEEKNLESEMKKLLKVKKVSLAYSLTEDIDAVLVHYRKELGDRFTNIFERGHHIAPDILDEVFEDALLYKASDIHFEPAEEIVRVRFRIDGIMQEAGRIPKKYYQNIINRIKVKARLRVDEHFAAQDGALRFVKGGNMADMRVSIIPTMDGEKTVIRVLSRYVHNFSLQDLGFAAKDQDIFLDAARKPFGMILVTGPTGSGKSTTLYALLKMLNQVDVNVTTIEDPVEYKMAGVNQIQVNTQTGLTFAKGLRSIVRQDPDIILLGEIRDEEAAEIAVNAALTGHLLLSTFHANNAATSIPRLLDMGIEPFLLASTLEVVISQRLVRKICESCRHSRKLTEADKKEYGKDIANHLKSVKSIYYGKGCEVCNQTGYHGRTAIFELINNTKELAALILENPSTQQIWDLAVKQGAHSMFADGMDKVKNGVTTIEEVTRVATES